MKLTHKILAGFLMVSVGIFSGCSDDDDDSSGTGPTTSQFDLLVDVTDDGMLDWTTGWIKDADYVSDNLADLYVIDLRAADAFAAGHIPGAINATPTDLPVVAAASAGKDIALVCYTGQTAAWGTMALRMLGYESAFSMKFGMSAWNQEFSAPWDNNVGSDYVNDFINDPSPALPENDAPTLSGSYETGNDVLAARVLEVLAEGYMGVSGDEVMTAPGDYNIVNYWAESDYTGIGHIDGALQVAPGTLTSDQNLSAFDPDNPNVIYCWTGQTGSLMSFYLRVLGFEVYNLRFGVNSMIHSALPSHTWTVGGLADFNFDYQTGSSVDEFALLSAYADEHFGDWNNGWIKDVAYTYDLMSDLFIIDLRSASDYNAGHIEGAVNVTLTDMLTVVSTQNTDNLEVAVVCYSGQTAAFATMALRMAGHNAYSMKFGMSAWRDEYNGSWMNNIGSEYSADMINDPSPTLPEYGYPTLNTGETDAMSILMARIDAVMAEGFGANAVSNDAVMDVPEDYHIYNYWAVADYEGEGHIPGAYQLDPGSVTTNGLLNALHPTETNVLYCWTGQTSALTTCYLNVMGYDMLSLKFGANGMMYDALSGHKWPEAGVGANYPVVTE